MAKFKRAGLFSEGRTCEIEHYVFLFLLSKNCRQLRVQAVAKLIGMLGSRESEGRMKKGIGGTADNDNTFSE